MDYVWSGLAALLGGAAGWGYGAYFGRMVAGRKPRAFWIAAAAAFVLGIGIAAAGGVAGWRPAAFLGFAFAGVAASVLKWVSGKVPGVRGGAA